ncbi:hypothetical protein [Stigmatella aurantiaca]|uniref:Uncharacterized protein n=1 Tax=Stigmatella aurantiaca (strain DW4/3-1) TaxID=378806 RepID=E3FQ95_STIAD|nr:hypothetical protein [Stigmatella aurantiaca]ADO68205.1 uncharacterized protein STAUR_0396 [Stigmatella aurantiaca DW4/3-1]
MDCLKDLEAQPLTFPDTATARAWVGRHQEELLVGGTIVLIAGVAFVALSGGTGAIVLVPLAAL